MLVEDHKKLTEELYDSANMEKPVDEPKQLARGYIRKELIEVWMKVSSRRRLRKNLDQAVSRMRKPKLH